MDLMRTLPDELWSDTFGFLGLQDLYVVSQVCAYWRRIASDHPYFWGTIHICTLSAGELGWASRRIAAGITRPVHFSVSIACPGADIDAVVFPLMRTILNRVRRLEINISTVYFERLCEILRSPVPTLEYLRLDMSSSPEHPIETFLPTDILGGYAGSLREVHLECVPLPPTPIPALSKAETVILSGHDGAWHQFPPALFSFFPAMRRLSLFGGSLQIPENISADTHTAFAQLDVMDVAYCPAENVKILRHFPATAAIRHIILSHSDRDTVRAAVAQLPRRLMMIFLQPAHSEIEIRIMYASCDASIIRTFVELHDDFLPGELNAANAMLCDPAFVSRIATLRISTSLWSLACPFFPSDDNRVEHLIVLVDDDGPHGDALLPTQRFFCPRLKTLVIQAMCDFVRTAVADLVALSHVVAGTRRIALELHRVVLRDDAKELEQHFTSIMRTNEHNQG